MIDNDIIENFLNCKYKAYLKHNKQFGSKTEFELLKQDLLKLNKTKFHNNLRVKFSNHQILDNFKFGRKTHVKNNIYAIEPTLQTKGLNISFDAFEIRPPNYSSKRASYIPISISPNEKIAKIEKLSLGLKCLILSQQKGITPEFGKIIYGNELKATKFKLDLYSTEAKRLLAELIKIISNRDIPPFYQNNHCKVCEFREICRTKLIEKDDLSLLGRFSQKGIIKKNNRGFFTIHQFSYTFRPKKRKKESDKPKRFEYALKALALREKQSYIQEIPKLPECKTEIYLDFEGLPDENFNYLIGIVIREGETEKRLSFWADSKEEEEKIFRQLFEFLSKFNDFSIYHYGSYEIKSLKKFNKKLDNKYEDEINFIIKKSFNILSLFTSNIYPPTYTNELKDIANFLGFKWSDKKASGIQSIVWRKKWELSKDIVYKNRLIQYNIEDCLALNLTKDWLVSIGNKLEQEPNEDFAKVEDLKVKGNYTHNFCAFISTNADFEAINKCAYFDYQREKIYLKTNKNIKRALKKKAKELKLANKVNKIVQIPVPKRCPRCNYDKLHKHTKHKKIVIDLKFMNNGVKKGVTQFNGGGFRCCKCRKIFMPEEYKRIYRYGRNLIIWSMNQHISFRVSFPNIDSMLSESFNIKVPKGTMYRFQKKLVNEYKDTFEEIKGNIIKGSLIHTDETSVSVNGISGYVWVFTNMDSVFYLFRPNREAEFLKELLKGFGGVLISDFYSGYDSIPCPQQKCLIHLIRDLNEDLFKNQLDAEFKYIVTNFGKLLRTIVDTINKYGLKKRHLNKHKKDVETFYNKIINKEYDSELAIKYQKRFKKYKDKLFAFLDYDSIPWNNNNAEHAIKAFAAYRRNVDGVFSEDGINDYLILLSIHQTCKYRGIRFLDFLKSREKSINDYYEKF